MAEEKMNPTDTTERHTAPTGDAPGQQSGGEVTFNDAQQQALNAIIAR
jgi:hypothetical protein